MDGTKKAVEEAWERYQAYPTLENARAYDEAVEQADEDVSRKTIVSVPHEWHGICLDCGPRYGRVSGREHVMSTSPGHCDWCGKDGVSVAQPRDYGYPRPPLIAVTDSER